MNEDILGIKINKDLQWFKMTLANGGEIDLVKKQDYIKLQNNWNELKKSIENDIKEYEESEFHIKEPPISIQTKINILIQMQEMEKKQ